MSSLRNRHAFDPVTRSPGRLPRGHAGPVEYLNFRPVATLNVTCEGRRGYTCKGLRRFVMTKEGRVAEQRYGNPLVHKTRNSIAETYEWECRCGAAVVLSPATVRTVLDELVARGEPLLELSATRVASLRL